MQSLSLTYLAQVRQLHFKNDNFLTNHAPIMHPILHTKKPGVFGLSCKAIVTTGTVLDADLEGQNKSTVAWLEAVERWLKLCPCISSRSRAKVLNYL